MTLTNSPQGINNPNAVDGLMNHVVQSISKVDGEAVASRIEKLRQSNPDASADELVEKLIQQKCMQTGAVGAITSGTAIIPGLGTFASLTFGLAADIGMTLKLQAELVLEIASVYQRELNSTEKRKAILLVAGFSTGTSQIMSRVGKEIAEKATERLAAKGVAKALPVLGVAASAGVNILSTYVIGKRAQAYFKLGEEAMQDWNESARAITGIDEQKIIAWLTETTEHSWKVASSKLQNLSGAVIVAGKSAGELVVIGASKAGEAVAGGAGAALQSAAALTEKTDAQMTVMSKSRNPLVKAYAAYVRLFIARSRKNLRFLYTLLRKIGAGISAIFSGRRHKPRKATVQRKSTQKSPTQEAAADAQPSKRA